jgi:hypothetical protein
MKGATMKRVLAGIGAALLLAVVVTAGALTSLGSAGTPAIRSTSPLTLAAAPAGQDHRAREHRPQHRERHHRRGREAHHVRSHGADD